MEKEQLRKELDFISVMKSVCPEEVLAYWKREYRQHLKQYNKERAQKSLIISNDECGNSWKEIYTIKYDGAKEELEEEFEELAENLDYEIRACGYDCTAKPILNWWKIGHIKGNLWKVCECRSIDV